jgi:hypothetical protein
MTFTVQDEKTQRVLAEIQARITAVYPEATFTVALGEDPVGIYLDAYTNAPDGFAVLDLVSDWLVDLNVNEGLAIHVIPLPTPARDDAAAASGGTAHP